MSYRVLKKTDVIKAGDEILRGRKDPSGRKRQRWFGATYTVGKRVEQVIKQDLLDLKNGMSIIPCIKVRRWKCDETKAGWTIEPGNPDRLEQAEMELDAFPPEIKTKTRKK